MDASKSSSILITNGLIFDPEDGSFAHGSLLIDNGRVVRSPASGGEPQIVDARGAFVVPGFVDLHTHIYPRRTFWGVSHDEFVSSSGTTTWLDAGSCGTDHIRDFKSCIADPSPALVRSFLNIASRGLIEETGELREKSAVDEEAIMRAVEELGPFLCGFKVRIDRHTVGTNGTAPLVHARRLSERTGLPLMVHIGEGPPEVDEVLDLLQNGDILTHCFAECSMSLLSPSSGVPRERAVAARERGVLFDLGHGMGGFSYRIAERMMAAGFLPDVISSDTHIHSVSGAMKDLPTCASKMLALGMNLQDVLTRVTAAPAAAVGMQGLVGSLSEGARGDVTIVRSVNGDWDLPDVHGVVRRASSRLEVDAVIAGGELIMSAGKNEPGLRPTR
jgi:dihydroorotase